MYKIEFYKYFSENFKTHYLYNCSPSSSYKNEFAWLSRSSFRSPRSTLHTIVVPEDISRSSVRPSSFILSLYNPPSKVRGTGSRNLGARSSSSSHLGCAGREARGDGGMDAFKIRVREREREVGGGRGRGRRFEEERRKRRDARAEDGSFEGAGRWSSS